MEENRARPAATVAPITSARQLGAARSCWATYSRGMIQARVPWLSPSNWGEMA